MTLATERSLIETRWADQWVTGSPSAARTPTGYDDHKFTPTPNGNSVRLTIANASAEQVSMGDPGNNVSRTTGVVFIQIFVPGGAGSATVRALADAAMAVFRNWNSGVLRFRIPYVSARVEDPPFLVWTIACPFQRDEFDA